jgi:hypothetical protein
VPLSDRSSAATRTRMLCEVASRCASERSIPTREDAASSGKKSPGEGEGNGAELLVAAGSSGSAVAKTCGPSDMLTSNESLGVDSASREMLGSRGSI